MPTVIACNLPATALLEKYVGNGIYTDCYRAEICGTVSQAQYVTAFYTTWIFKIERTILKWVVAKPSTDDQASQLADGRIDKFAAWQVEDSCDNQLLLSDFRGRTRSWFMTLPAGSDSAQTSLYFGSAVIPVTESDSGNITAGRGYQALLGFHQLYSRVLLYSARLRLLRQLREI